jgi:DNA polymerase-3 subunit epsilon
MFEHLSLRLRIFLFFALIATGSAAAIGAGMYVGYLRLDEGGPVSALVVGGMTAGFVIVGLVTWVWYLFDENVARAILRLAGGMRTRAHAEGGANLDGQVARYLGDLAPAALAVTETLAETRNALAEAVQRETTRLADEKERLEALLSDVPVGVLLCSSAHQLVFYNGQAVEVLGGGAIPGLDRPVFEHLREPPIRQAYDRLVGTGDPDAASDLICTTVGGARVLAARMRLVGADAAPGYVLTLRDVTADIVSRGEREAMLADGLDRLRRQSAAVQSLFGAIEDDLPAGAPVTLALGAEVANLTRTVSDLSQGYDRGQSEVWPLVPVRAADLADALKARLEASGLNIRVETADLILRCDSYQLVELVARLAEGVAGELAATGLSLEIAEDGSGATVDLVWTGRPASVGQVEAWLDAPIGTDMPGLIGRAVLGAHATECWPEPRPAGQAAIRLPIREVRRAARRPAPIARRVVYDFDLLSRSVIGELASTPLERLTYVVFDSETTGLLPSQGDELVQLAAVRIVNGRRVAGEVFDTLVNPARTIPARSTEVHGITDAMVHDAPSPPEAVGQFLRFCEGAVLVAHNAPFDMEFLRRHENAAGGRFEHAVLDTVLLSAVVFGQSEQHSLDALTHRLGITIPEEARHTAIGDTVATADAFLRLLSMLKGMGLNTFGDVLAEVRRHGRLLKDLNA